MKWTWNKENEKTLSDLWLADMPVSGIARALGPKVTRNMVIGKAHRLHLPGRDIAKFVRIAAGKKYGRLTRFRAA